MSDPYASGLSGDPARPDPGSGNIFDILRACDDVWAAIAKFVDSRVDRTIKSLILNSTKLTTVACTVGTPGVLLVANPLVSWATIEIPFPAVFERFSYYGAGGHPCQIDVRVIRPGGAAPGGSAIPGGPPTFDIDIAFMGTRAGDYIEPGSALAFYVSTADGAECVTCNVILRTLG